METIQGKIVDQVGPEGESVVREAGKVVSASKAGDGRKEKIDPKKLVLYSEIMKTKF